MPKFCTSLLAALLVSKEPAAMDIMPASKESRPTMFLKKSGLGWWGEVFKVWPCFEIVLEEKELQKLSLPF